MSTPHPAPHKRHNQKSTADIHPGVYYVALASWAALFAIFWMIFGGERQGAFMLMVDMVFLAAFFGTPYLMLRIHDRAMKVEHLHTETSFADFLKGDFETMTGLISGVGALVQIIVVPCALALGLIGIGLVIMWVRSGYL